MKIIIIILLAIMTACCTDPKVDKRLSHAESIMESAPDSALLILNGIDPIILKGDRNRALYALLMTQAQDKAMIDIADTCLINRAANFFSDDDPHHRMLTLYYLGKCLYNLADYTGAIIRFMKAAELASTLGNAKYLGMIYREISTVYFNIYASKEQLHYAKKAYEAFKQYPDSSYAWYSMNDLANAYCSALDYKNSLRLSNMTLKIAQRNNDSMLMNQAITLIGISQIGLRKYQEAISTYEALMNRGSLETHDFERYLLAVSHSGDKAKIDSLSKVIAANKHLISVVPHEFIILTGNYKEAYKSLKRRCDSQDKLIRKVLTQNVTRTINSLTMFEKMKAENALEKTEVQKTFIITVAMIIFITLIIIYMMRTSAMKKKEEEFILDAENMKNELKDKKTAFAQTISDLIGKRYEILDNLCSSYYDPVQSSKSQKQIYNEIKKQIGALTGNELGAKELESYVNRYTDNLISQVREHYPNLKGNDIKLLLYCILGLSTRTICILIGEKAEIVYNRKSRLKAKIKEADTPCRDVLLRYF